VSNPIFSEIPKENFPLHESLKDLVQRTVPFWVEEIEPQILAGKRILVVAHGTSLRGLVKHIKNVVRKYYNITSLEKRRKV
jgi:2,3-bisphosphoglycerate-dependent phosphoglycerate mutase